MKTVRDQPGTSYNSIKIKRRPAARSGTNQPDIGTKITLDRFEKNSRVGQNGSGIGTQRARLRERNKLKALSRATRNRVESIQRSDRNESETQAKTDRHRAKNSSGPRRKSPALGWTLSVSVTKTGWRRIRNISNPGQPACHIGPEISGKRNLGTGIRRVNGGRQPAGLAVARSKRTQETQIQQRKCPKPRNQDERASIPGRKLPGTLWERCPGVGAKAAHYRGGNIWAPGCHTGPSSKAIRHGAEIPGEQEHSRHGDTRGRANHARNA